MILAKHCPIGRGMIFLKFGKFENLKKNHLLSAGCRLEVVVVYSRCE
jgi:hypothetical protein